MMNELKEWAMKYLNIKLYPYQEKFIEMLLRKKKPQQLKDDAIDKMVINRVSRALTGYRIRKQSVLDAILQEISVVMDPVLMIPRHQGKKTNQVWVGDILMDIDDVEVDLTELGEQYAAEREGYDDR